MPIRTSPMAVALLAGSFVVACGQTPSPAPKSAPAEVDNKVAAKPAEPAKAGKAKKWGAFPPEARRNTAPEGIVARAVGEGATAPAFTLGDFTLADALSKTTYVVLVFYRGAW